MKALCRWTHRRRRTPDRRRRPLRGLPSGGAAFVWGLGGDLMEVVGVQYIKIYLVIMGDWSPWGRVI